MTFQKTLWVKALTLALAWLTALPWPALAQQPSQPSSIRPEAKLHLIRRLELKETRVVDAVRLIAETSGLNIITTQEAGQQLVTLFLQDVTAIGAIEAMAKSANLWYREDNETGTIRVMTTAEYQRDLIVFRDDFTKVFTLLHPNTTSVAMAIRDLYGPRVVLSLSTVNDDMFIQQGGGGGGFGGGGFGGGGGGFGGGGFGGGGFGGGGFGGGGSGFGNQFGGSGFGGGQAFGFGPGNSFGSFPGGGGFGVGTTGLGGGFGFGNGFGGGGFNNGLNARDMLFPEEGITAAQAANIERQRAEANTTNGSVDGAVNAETIQSITSREPPIYVTINRQHNLVIIRTSDTKVMEDIERLISELDRPTPEVLLEMKIVELTIDDDFRSVFDVGFTPGPQEVNPNLPPPVNPLVPGAATAAQSILGLGNFPVEGGTVVYQFLNDTLRARIQLFDSDNRVNIVASPLVLASNNRPASIFVGQQVVLTTGVSTAIVTPANGAATTAISPQTEVRDVGTTLFFTPRIDSDRTVTLFIVQDSSTVIPNANTILVAGANGVVTPQQVDGVATRNIQATVVAKDGLTIAIGGLITTRHTNLQQKVPLLGDLPLVGIFFRRTVREDQKIEQILLITPHVITTPVEGEMKSRWRLDELSHSPVNQRFSAHGTPQFDYRRYPPPAAQVLPPEWQGPAIEEVPTGRPEFRTTPQAQTSGTPGAPPPPNLPTLPPPRQ